MVTKKTVQEDETKNILKVKYFSEYDWTRVIGKIDLTVSSQPKLGVLPTNFLWAETKQGKKKDIYESFIQLILTIGKGRIYEQEMPPYFLGAADAEKIAFVEYNKVMHIFSKTDFNWNVTPSDHSSKEFKELFDLLHDDLANDVVIYKYAFDDKHIHAFIKSNFKEGKKGVKKQSVGKNNFTFVYYDWVKSVKNSIAVDWKSMEKAGVLDCDFFLADLMSKDGMSIKDKLKVVLEKTKYKVLVKANLGGIFGDAFQEFSFKDGQKAYYQFWNRYERPPKQIYQRYILERRDLLVPQDIREIKGSYYTPEQWVRLSQEYLSMVLGEDWQEEYYVWDCSAGSGNLLRGLTNRYNVYASTLDDTDVKVMHDAIEGGRLNLLKNNVFQFDFLNDSFEKCPESLRSIINNPEKRKKLILYNNFPYAETATKRVSDETRINKRGVSFTKVQRDYGGIIGIATKELFAQFLIRISVELKGCYIANFSKVKHIQGPNFNLFRKEFDATFRKGFLVPADTFDNVKGSFPIGFMIWDTSKPGGYDEIVCDVYDSRAENIGEKWLRSYSDGVYITDWFRNYHHRDESSENIGAIGLYGSDFQHANFVYITNPSNHTNRWTYIRQDNLLQTCIYLSARLAIAPTWLNDRDQFLYPKPTWQGDIGFQTDCLVYTLFHGQNRIISDLGENNWIPFYEYEVDAPAPFNSRFMADFLHGKIARKPIETTGDLFEQQAAEEAAKTKPIDALSDEARAVLEAGKEIWKYYMTKPGIRANASFLDIRAFFQGFKTTEKGKTMMNSSSSDAHYMDLLTDLRGKIKALEAHIEPKIYEHGFLLR